MNGTHICSAHLGVGMHQDKHPSTINLASAQTIHLTSSWEITVRYKSPHSKNNKIKSSVSKKGEKMEEKCLCVCKYRKWRMNQKFSQQRKPWFQLPDCLMSHSMLVNNIPYHSRTTIYSQNQDPPPSSLRQFHHPPRETPPKAERVARSSSGNSNLFSPLSLFPLPCSLFLSSLYFCASSLIPFCLHFFFSLPALPLRLARWMKT